MITQDEHLVKKIIINENALLVFIKVMKASISRWKFSNMMKLLNFMKTYHWYETSLMYW